MEPNSMPGGIYSTVQPGSVLGLEMSLHHPLQPQNPLPHHHHHRIMNFAHDDDGYANPQTQAQAHPLSGKPKNQAFTLSDDDEPASADDGKKKLTPPWQRMKWTDNMVRLLIMVVFYIGDEVVSEANNGDANVNGKKKGGGAAAGGVVLQKKGKWKSVSRAMMERGFYVSPQQCEDKFNDLNKRYKRVNDILGKGVSCRVVENQSLLDSMDHVSPKLKDEVKKLLNSKHLFFREMCAYHNSCGHGGAAAAGGPMPPASATLQQPSQGCLHNVSDVPNLNRGDHEDDNADSDENADSDADSDSDDHEDTNFLDNERPSSRKRVKRGLPGPSLLSPLIQQLDIETTSVLRDPTKGPSEKRRWMRTKLVRLEEEKVGIQVQTFDIEKQRLKWLKFSGKKEREMERERLANERLRLENERMVLMVRQKELDLIEQQQHSSNRKSDPSSITG